MLHAVCCSWFICLPKGDQSPKAWSEKRGTMNANLKWRVQLLMPELEAACFCEDGATEWLSKTFLCPEPEVFASTCFPVWKRASSCVTNKIPVFSLSLFFFSCRSLQFIVVLLDTTKESSLDWTRYPYGPQSRTPGVSIMIWCERTSEYRILSSSPCLVPIFFSTSANLSSFASFHASDPLSDFPLSFLFLFFTRFPATSSYLDIESLFYRPLRNDHF